MEKFVTSGRLLEIGASYGAFAFLAKQAGFEVEAIEMDAQCCRFLTDVVGVRSINSSDLAEVLRAAGPYHVIALWHTVEHLPNPWATIEMIANRLFPGGILIISTPNPKALQFRIFGRFWVNVDAPRHLQLIPAPLLIRFMKRRGLKTVLTTTTDHDGLTLNKWGWEVSLMNLFIHLRLMEASTLRALLATGVKPDGSASERLQRPTSPVGSFVRLLAILRRLAGRAAAVALAGLTSAAFCSIERKGWCGSAYTVVFKKDHADGVEVETASDLATG